MNDKHRFQAIIQNAGDGGAFVTIPFDVVQVFGKKRVKVKAWINGEPYRGTLVRMGEPFHVLIVLKEIRVKIGKSFGDEVEVIVEEDDEPRFVSAPPDLNQALIQHPKAEAIFQRLSYTHQKEYVKWIEESKREATRQSRIMKTIEMLEQGKKTR
jgi:Bacteriocin-protection, YdeI or OmpD-Associated/Domain of unknown function (DUF1905)